MSKFDEDPENDKYEGFGEEPFNVNDIINIKESRGTLSGRCIKILYVSVSPKKRRTYKLKIGYSLIDNDSLELDCMVEGWSWFDVSFVFIHNL